MTSLRSSLKKLLDWLGITRNQQSLLGRSRPLYGLSSPVSLPSMPSLKAQKLLQNSPVLEFGFTTTLSLVRFFFDP
ncbi:hypothetical protein Ahy_B01g053292 isoform D [Arachis hypogaea]|uniref:Uncharacterized protein n=2 Tax=Arachis hypogaea TaxID=3818 RepID=A0A445ARF5_ARAHY|nr:hypothetical protein Ahy_B01g053292 isoform D [Arachis hypogaea]